MEMKELVGMVKETQSGIVSLGKGLEALQKKMGETPASNVWGLRNAIAYGPQHAAGVRTGEDPNSSRGFSFMKMLGVLANQVDHEYAKVEIGIHKEIHDQLGKYLGSNGMGGVYDYAVRAGKPGQDKFLAPLGSAFFHNESLTGELRGRMKSLVAAGTDGDDPEERVWIRRRMLKNMGYGQKALSWLNELTGGAIVAPPEQGELIELLRNKEAMVNAGARVVPLPPQGRLKYPKQTAASNTFWVGENSPITESLLGTGEVTLQAKKLCVLIKAPNELIRFASPAAEALMRDDMTKSLALGLDLAALEGGGGDTRPRGLINLQNITKINSSQQTANGDYVRGEDIYRMIAAVEEANAEFEAFIMRPKTLYKYYQLRADAVGQGDKAGMFLFNLIREASADTPATLGSYPAVKSTQVSQVRVKGGANNLTYIVGGMFSDFLIGMFGAIEFAATTLGDTPFINDQTWVRGILSADCTARHDSAFVWMDNLDTTL